ncbi:MAG: SGNH/GDSL hydrolase family protein [Micromonosporaceae bacterium]
MAQWGGSSFVAVGDSFTEGLDDPDGEGGYRGWADLVAARLASSRPGLRYANLAVRGRLLDAVVSEQVPAAVAMTPDLVSFAAGGNDVLRPGFDPDRVRATLGTVVRRFTDVGARVVLFTAADLSTVLPGMVRPRVVRFNEAIRVVAGGFGASLVDLWADDGFRHARMWREDRLHLSTYGHRRVAATVLDALGEPYDSEWRATLPPEPPKPWLSARQADLRWARQHLTPWIRRRLAGRSSGDTVTPKRPELSPVFSGGADQVP